MRKITSICACLLGMSTAVFAVNNYYQGDGVNNFLTTAESWSEGVLTENDVVIFSEDGWTVRNEVAATATSGSVGFTHLRFNSNIENDFRLFSNSDLARLRVTGRITIENGVAGVVNLDGRWNFRDMDLNIDHFGTNTLKVTWMMRETTGTPGADLNYFGTLGGYNKILFQTGKAGTGKSNYGGRTVLANVDAEVSVVADASGGALGLGADIRLNLARLALVDSGTLSNAQITIMGTESVFDVSTRTNGNYSYEGVVRGDRGRVVGDLELTGELRPGDETGGIGTLTFEDELSLVSGSTNFFEIEGSTVGEFDQIVTDTNGTLVVDSGSVWVFDFSGWTNGTPAAGETFAVLDGWDSITGSSENITVIGLAGEYALNTTDLFQSGEVSIYNVTPPVPEITVDGDNVVICWEASGSASYVVQRKTDLVGDAVWSNVVEGVEGPGTICVTNDTTDPQAFYKVLFE